MKQLTKCSCKKLEVVISFNPNGMSGVSEVGCSEVCKIKGARLDKLYLGKYGLM